MAGPPKPLYENDVMVPAFNKALETVSAMPFDELVKAGMFSGIDVDDEAEEDAGR